jgi:hypothetical protein
MKKHPRTFLFPVIPSSVLLLKRHAKNATFILGMYMDSDANHRFSYANFSLQHLYKEALDTYLNTKELPKKFTNLILLELIRYYGNIHNVYFATRNYLPADLKRRSVDDLIKMEHKVFLALLANRRFLDDY